MRWNVFWRGAGLAPAMLAMFAVGAEAFQAPIVPLNEAQLKALGEYAAQAGEKAFAAGPDGRFSAQAGFASASVAAREALKACDAGASDAAKRCILIDLNGVAVPQALQIAQASRANAAYFDAPLPLGDLTLDVDAWQALAGLEGRGEHKAFALSLKGPWARSWEAASLEEAEVGALEACNKKPKSAQAPCFILARDKERVGADDLAAKSDLSVERAKPQEP